MTSKSDDLPPFDKVAGAYFDPKGKRLIIVTKDVLVNQLKRDCPKIAETFDEMTGDDLEKVGTVLGFVTTIIASQMIGADPTDESRGATCGRLISTATTTFIGCVHLARGGFRLQYMALSRSVIETISTVLHLMVAPDAIRSFHRGKLKSTHSIGNANKVLPGFSRIWGDLSNQFVHIGKMHSGLNPLTGYSRNDDALDVIRMNMRIISWLLLVATELAFIEDIPHPRYWKIIDQVAEGNHVAFDPSEEVRTWDRAYLGDEWMDEMSHP